MRRWSRRSPDRPACRSSPPTGGTECPIRLRDEEVRLEGSYRDLDSAVRQHHEQRHNLLSRSAGLEVDSRSATYRRTTNEVDPSMPRKLVDMGSSMRSPPLADVAVTDQGQPLVSDSGAPDEDRLPAATSGLDQQARAAAHLLRWWAKAREASAAPEPERIPSMASLRRLGWSRRSVPFVLLSEPVGLIGGVDGDGCWWRWGLDEEALSPRTARRLWAAALAQVLSIPCFDDDG